MRAITKLEVKDNMRVTVTLDLDIGEVRAILARLSEAPTAWPMGSLRNILHESLSKATQAYASQHEID